MTLHWLQALSWGTVTGAVVSALALAAVTPATPESPRQRAAARTAGSPAPAGARSGVQAHAAAPHATKVAQAPAR
ncbi:MAG TPA: hypothetical protein VFZ93_08065 [Albitalea sp.]